MAKITDNEKRMKESALKRKDEAFARVLTPKNFKDMKKDEFKKQFKGKLPFDLDQAWAYILKNR